MASATLSGEKQYRAGWRFNNQGIHTFCMMMRLYTQRKNTVLLTKTGLVLIIGVLLIGACSPSAPARQTNLPIVASLDGGTQPLPATPTPGASDSQPLVSFPTVESAAPTESPAAQPEESDEDLNPETSFPLAPDTQWDAGNGDSGEVESAGQFSLHSQATVATVNQFYQSGLSSLGWQLRYIDANHAGGLTQYWKQGLLYMSVDFGYDNSGLAIQVQWHQLDPEYIQILARVLTLPGQADLVTATDSTWEVYIPQGMEAAIDYFRQKAAALDWKPSSVPYSTAVSCSGDCLNKAVPTYSPGVTPMPTRTPDPRQPQMLCYTTRDGNEISLAFTPHQASTVLNITVLLKNVASAGLPKELPIYPGATDMVIAPGMVRFTVSTDVKTTVQFYTNALASAGWTPFAGYSLDTPQLYYQEWDKGDQAVRLHISSPGSSSSSSQVSIQCVVCAAP